MGQYANCERSRFWPWRDPDLMLTARCRGNGTNRPPLARIESVDSPVRLFESRRSYSKPMTTLTSIPSPRPPPHEWPMSHWLHKPATRQDVVTIRKVWVTLVVSLLVHTAALLLFVTHPPLPGPEQQAVDEESTAVQVELAEAKPPVPTPPPARAEPAAQPPPRVPRPAARVRPPPMIAMPRLEAPAIRTPALAPPPQIAAAPAPPQAKPPAQGDFLSFVQANRRARGAAESAQDNSEADFNTRIAANLPGASHGVAAQVPVRGGGMFQMKRMTYDDAAFEFFGWNTEMGRRTPQLIEVRKGNNPNMQIAVVRRMIAIIRQYSHEDFTWDSGRHGRIVTLSARPADTAALEQYLLHDMFDDTRDGR